MYWSGLDYPNAASSRARRVYLSSKLRGTTGQLIPISPAQSARLNRQMLTRAVPRTSDDVSLAHKQKNESGYSAGNESAGGVVNPKFRLYCPRSSSLKDNDEIKLSVKGLKIACECD